MSKDWTGNKKSVFATLGASSHSKQERESNDFYATDPVAIDRLASKFDIPHKVWECACGKGHLSDRLKSLGHDVYSTDIIDRGYSQFDGVLDFLNPLFYPHENDRCVLTNPPFKFLSEFVLNALEWLPEGGYACFFLKTTAIESRGRYERIFKNCPPLYIFQFIDRILCAKNGEFENARENLGAGAQAYAWFVWRKGYQGKPQLDWI